MGRKKIKEPKEQLTVMVNPKTKKEVERLAQKVGLTPSQIGANLMEIALEDALFLEKLGILKTALIAQSVFKKIMNKKIKGEEIEVADMIVE